MPTAVLIRAAVHEPGHSYPICPPGWIVPASDKESNNTRAGGVKACSAADQGKIVAVLLYRRPAAATAWPPPGSIPQLIAGGSLDKSQLC